MSHSVTVSSTDRGNPDQSAKKNWDVLVAKVIYFSANQLITLGILDI